MTLIEKLPKNIYLGKGINIPSVVRLPTAYQEVEYIESTGTQYINTGYIPNTNTEIEADISWGEGQLAWATFFWVTRNDSSSDWVLWRIFGWSLETFNPRFCNSSYDECQVSANVNAFNKITLKRNWWTINWTAFTVTTTWTPYSSSMDIFAWNSWWVHWWRASKCKIKTFKISESWTLKRNFVPCYRKSDWVIWMYDLVNSVFYTNWWTWEFLMGDYVKVKTIYKWDNRLRPYINIPDSHTRYYVKWDGNITDYSWHITFSWRNVTYNTEWNLSYISVGNWTAVYNTSQNITLPLTFNLWLYVSSSIGSSTYPRLLAAATDGSSYLYINLSWWSWVYNVFCAWNDYPWAYGFSYWHWYNIWVSISASWAAKIYVDWKLMWWGNCAYWLWSQLWMLSRWTTSYDSFTGKVSKLLYQNEIWDDDSFNIWYEQTKSLYPVSWAKAWKNTPKFWYLKPQDIKEEKEKEEEKEKPEEKK